MGFHDGRKLVRATARNKLPILASCILLSLWGCTADSQQDPSSGSPGAGATSENTGATGSDAPAALPREWSDTASHVAPSVVAISARTSGGGGAGSGVILDNQGRVVTNHHVVAGVGSEGQILVTLADERVFDARIVGSDPTTDLAVLQMTDPPSDLQPITVGNSDELSVGDPVMAVGNPLGLDGTVTTGIVSALDRPVSTNRDGPSASPESEPVVTNAIQTSAAINPGNSGGALVDAQGRLVGINSSIASLGQNQGNIGIGFAITSRQMQSVVDQILGSGTVQHAYLGIGVRDIIVQTGESRRWAAGVARVEPGSPAAQAGLQEGDGIVAIDGEAVDSALSLIAQVRERPVGTEVELSVVRDGERREVAVSLAARPTP